MHLVLFQRRPRSGSNHSVELIVQGLVETFSPDIAAEVAVSRYESNGIWHRLYNVVEASLRQGDVNHVTGDVNFLTYLLAKRKTVLTVLDCGRIVGKQDLRKHVIRLLWFTLPTRRCAVVTVISEDVKRQLLEQVRIDPNKVRVIPVAVPSFYRHMPRPFREVDPVILQVGTAPNKNLPRLIEALSGIRCRLEIIGPLDEAQRRLLEKHAIDYRNHVNLDNDAMLERYADCDVVSFASTFEGFGMPIIEANIVGRPVLAGAVASMPEVAGDAACLVDPFDVAAIRAGLLRILEDSEYRESLVCNGFENAKRYSASAITAQYEAVYREVGESSHP